MEGLGPGPAATPPVGQADHAGADAGLRSSGPVLPPMQAHRSALCLLNVHSKAATEVPLAILAMRRRGVAVMVLTELGLSQSMTAAQTAKDIIFEAALLGAQAVVCRGSALAEGVAIVLDGSFRAVEMVREHHLAAAKDARILAITAVDAAEHRIGVVAYYGRATQTHVSQQAAQDSLVGDVALVAAQLEHDHHCDVVVVAGDTNGCMMAEHRTSGKAKTRDKYARSLAEALGPVAALVENDVHTWRGFSAHDGAPVASIIDHVFVSRGGPYTFGELQVEQPDWSLSDHAMLVLPFEHHGRMEPDCYEPTRIYDDSPLTVRKPDARQLQAKKMFRAGALRGVLALRAGTAEGADTGQCMIAQLGAVLREAAESSLRNVTGGKGRAFLQRARTYEDDAETRGKVAALRAMRDSVRVHGQAGVTRQSTGAEAGVSAAMRSLVKEISHDRWTKQQQAASDLKERLRVKVKTYDELARAVKRADVQTPGMSAVAGCDGALHRGPVDMPHEMARQMIAVGDDFAAVPLLPEVDEDEILELRLFADMQWQSCGHCGPTDPAEVRGRLKALQKRKSPGGDAVTAEMLQLFAHDDDDPVLLFLVDAVSQFLDTGFLTDDLKTGIVKHLLKNAGATEQEMLLLTKYRPITMQSVIVKLAASIFVHRVRSQSHDGNRHPQQRGWKSRLGTHEAARVLLSATSIALAKGEPLVLCFGDGRKARCA